MLPGEIDRLHGFMAVVPVKLKNVGSSFEQPAIEEKCFSRFMNVIESMYPDPRSLTTPNEIITPINYNINSPKLALCDI